MLPVRRFSPTLFDLLAPSDQAGPCPLSGLSIDVWRGWDSSHSEQPLSSASALPPLRLAVVGHVEWVEFLAVDQLPIPGRSVMPFGPCKNLLVVVLSLLCRWHGCSNNPFSSLRL
ncbi:MAG: hypothetical protein CM15mP39_08350 [Synechococcus sp.]|nr:MAG: hypothetical protein CM15mP39_08350 [Synechococcus sp.]